MKILSIAEHTIILLIILVSYSTSFSQVKILFDATKAESAGNADWVIDADAHNISWSNGPAVVGSGTESNPQRIPTPAQSTITSSTVETYWNGGLSSWGIDLVKKGYTVETLPYNVAITYNNTSNVQDLSNYKVFIVCEPNIMFTTAEKTAIMQFVKNGGGLFMVSDHDQSDRNNDGNDSPTIWNDLMSNNSVQANPFGITFDLLDISGSSSNVATLPTDTLLHGPMGNVTQVLWTNGTTMTLNTTANSSVKGIIYKSGSSTTGTTNVMVARANYGSGKVAAIGDSSPCDDGSGDPNDQLYTGWAVDASGNHEKLIINATIWLASSSTTDNTSTGALETEKNIQLSPNPFSNYANLIISPNVNVINGKLNVYDMNGRIVKTMFTNDAHLITIYKEKLQKGIYFYQLTSNDKLLGNGKFIITE